MKNKYGLDVEYYTKELNKLTESLPDRSPDELWRYLDQLKIAVDPDTCDPLSQPKHSKQIGWISVEDKPIIRNLKESILDGGKSYSYEFDEGVSFIGAIPLSDGKWETHHFILVDGYGLMVVGDDENYPSGWEPMDVTHWIPWPESPKETQQEQDYKDFGDATLCANEPQHKPNEFKDDGSLLSEENINDITTTTKIDGDPLIIDMPDEKYDSMTTGHHTREIIYKRCETCSHYACLACEDESNHKPQTKQPPTEQQQEQPQEIERLFEDLEDNTHNNAFICKKVTDLKNIVLNTITGRE